MRSMVITTTAPSGIKCQVGDFSLLINPPSKRKGSLILRTRAGTPVDSFGPSEVLQGPGEYEIAGVRVRGVSLAGDASPKEIRSAYIAEFENMRLAFLLDISDLPSEEVLDRLGEVDILFLSAPGKKPGAKQLATLIKQIGPSVVVPVDEKTTKALNEEMGQKTKAQEKLVIKRKDLVQERATNKLVWLKTT